MVTSTIIDYHFGHPLSMIKPTTGSSVINCWPNDAQFTHNNECIIVHLQSSTVLLYEILKWHRTVMIVLYNKT